MAKNVIIFGAGGHAMVIADILEALGYIVIGYLDDNIVNEKVLGKVTDYINYPDCVFIIGIGNNYIRKKISKECKCEFLTAIHPSALVSKTAQLGKGTVVMPNVVINAEATIGEHCIINTSAVVEHECQVGNYVHLSPAAVLCGNVAVGDMCHIGAGATIKNNITITPESVVGLSAAVVRDITESGIYAGVPAKQIKKHL